MVENEGRSFKHSCARVRFFGGLPAVSFFPAAPHLAQNEPWSSMAGVWQRRPSMPAVACSTQRLVNS